MSSNYEWQKQYTNQRIRAAQQAADTHRAVKAAQAGAPSRPGLLTALVASFGRLFRRTRTTDKSTAAFPTTGKPAGQSK